MRLDEAWVQMDSIRLRRQPFVVMMRSTIVWELDDDTAAGEAAYGARSWTSNVQRQMRTPTEVAPQLMNEEPDDAAIQMGEPLLDPMVQNPSVDWNGFCVRYRS